MNSDYKVSHEAQQMLDAADAVAKFLYELGRDFGHCLRCGKETRRLLPTFYAQDPFPFCSESCKFWGPGNPRGG